MCVSERAGATFSTYNWKHQKRNYDGVVHMYRNAIVSCSFICMAVTHPVMRANFSTYHVLSVQLIPIKLQVRHVQSSSN